jgi:hypothetical protein
MPHAAECKECLIEYGHGREPDYIDFCPLHAQAGAMRDALEALIWASDRCQGHRACAHDMEPWKRARALLAATGGATHE